MLLSAGDICEQYQTLGMVVGFASKTEGWGGGIKIEDAYATALDRLKDSAQAKGANAVIHINFQNRVGSSSGCGGQSQVLEVFAWGTAVKY